MRRRVLEQRGGRRHLELAEITQVLLRRAHSTIRLDCPTVEHQPVRGLYVDLPRGNSGGRDG